LKTSKTQTDALQVYYDQESAIQIYSLNHFEAAGEYTVVISPNRWIDHVKIYVIICFVEQPATLFYPETFSFEFKPEAT
jgi:hypothetical protein